MAGVFYLNLEELKRQALRRGMSVTQLAKLAGLSYQVIVTADRGGKATPKSIYKLAAALECDPLDIVKE